MGRLKGLAKRGLPEILLLQILLTKGLFPPALPLPRGSTGRRHFCREKKLISFEDEIFHTEDPDTLHVRNPLPGSCPFPTAPVP